MSLIAPILSVSQLGHPDAAFACMSRESSFSPTTTEPSFWSTLLQRMNPRICLASLEGDLPLDVAVPIIRANLKSELKKKKAMQQLYDLTDQKHAEHRLEIVSKYNILKTLIPLLSQPDTRRMALLILNNLAIPVENKHLFVAQNSTLVLQSLYSVIQEGEPDTTYLACLCLRNLTLVEDTLHTTRLLSFRAGDDGTDLLTLLETLTLAFAPQVLHAATITTDAAANRIITTAKYHSPNNNYTTRKMKQLYLHSAEALALKWSIGILQQLSLSHAAAIAQHEQCIVTLLQLLQHMSQHLPLQYWTVDSLPDCCLLVIFNLAPTQRTLLQRISAQHYLNYLVDPSDNDQNNGSSSSRNIHEMRASWIQCSLEV